MERDELIHRISVGSAYMQRPGLTDDQIQMARIKVERYREQLREIDSEQPQTDADKAKAEASIERIRQMLDGAKPRRRAL
jgi:hypothetical protein